MAELSFFGGVGEIGGNKILVTSGEDRVFLDFGKNFAREKEYFEEPFLSPRSVRHLLYLGILPTIPGLYKGDEGTPAPDAVAISHAHTDHYDHVRFVKDEVPLICSDLTQNLILAREFCSHAPVAGERIAHMTSKSKTCEKKFRTSQHGVVPLGGLSLTQVPVDHSIPGAMGTLLDDGELRLAYTGDIRFHGPRRDDSLAFIDSASSIEPDLLIVEGTGIQGARMAGEEDVRCKALEVVKATSGLVMVGYPVFDFDRMRTFSSIAEEVGRTLAISMKQAFALQHLEERGVGLPLPRDTVLVFERSKSKRYSHESEVVDRWPSEVMTTDELTGRQRELMLTFNLFDMNESLDIEPLPGSAYILSSSEPFNEEMWISYDRLKNWLVHLGVPLYQVHASGHARPYELKEMIEMISPRTVVPVHTEAPELFKQFLGDLDVKLIMPVHGETLIF